jgi:hypothetical protein
LMEFGLLTLSFPSCKSQIFLTLADIEKPFETASLKWL